MPFRCTPSAPIRVSRVSERPQPAVIGPQSLEAFSEPIYVGQPTMPRLEDYTGLLAKIWERRWLTNQGEMHVELERRLDAYLETEHLSLFCNGTLALMVALQMLRLNKGEIITTPFTFPATAHVLYWNGIKPVFCDIDPHTYNLDPARIEGLITPDTRAIVPVHVYGTPCDVDAIQTIADRHGLPVIYDAAHAFGARYRGRSLCSYGDAAVLSFHATKLFTTGEGGALIVRNGTQKARVDYLKNFGIAGPEEVIGPGINGKMNEFQAAFGLLQLDGIAQEIANRRAIDRRYRSRLGGLPGLTMLAELPDAERNYSYFPILVDAAAYGHSRDELCERLARYNVFARKYFFPLCSQYPCYASLPSSKWEVLPNAERIARQVLCLPMYGGLPLESVDRIAAIVESFHMLA